MLRGLIIGFIGFMLISCTSIVNTGKLTDLPDTTTVVVLPFENHTETPMAGLRVASLLESILRTKGYVIEERFWKLKDVDYTPEEIKGLLKEARQKGVDYVFTGSVNEFRYKTGIDGEPAVSITVDLYNTADGKVIWSSAGSATGWSHESTGTVTQKLLNKLVRK